MRKQLLAAGIAAAALIPTFAMAQQTCEQRSTNRVAGTVVGAGIGAILGSAVAANGHKGDGALVGAGVGGLIGNQAAKGGQDCQHAYGYYDNNNTWRPTQVARENARGYYDRNGNWVDGAPTGYYDRDGRWTVVASSVGTYGSPANYNSDDRRWDDRRDVTGRMSFLEQRINRGLENRTLDRREGRQALRDLDRIRQEERGMRHRNGRLNGRDEAYVQARLDDLTARVRADRRD